MSTLRFANSSHWDLINEHISKSSHRETFAFAFTKLVSDGAEGPVLLVDDIHLVPEADVEPDGFGWTISDDELDRVHNRAIKAGLGLVEFHCHSIGPPRFSPTDEQSLGPTAEYITAIMPGRPYGAAVVADGQVFAQYWTRISGDVSRGTFRSVVVLGDCLKVLNAEGSDDPRLQRQLPLLTASGSDALGSLRVGIVGAGGTGSQVTLALAYIGVRDYVILDDDVVEESNLNRLVTGGAADIGAPKNLVARRRARELDPSIRVVALPAIAIDHVPSELIDCDVIFGCVDHDGPRDLLNQISVDAAIPFFDIATGVDPDSLPLEVGGRVTFVGPGRPCLHCTQELDPYEVGRWSKRPEQQVIDRAHGYGIIGNEPSVVHLNGLAANAAVGEFVAWITGHRQPANLSIDLVGESTETNRTPGMRILPQRPSGRNPDCIACSNLRDRGHAQ